MGRSRPLKTIELRLFKCIKRGEWETVDRTFDGSHYGIYFMINQWEAYRSINSEPITGDMIARAYTFGELIDEIRQELAESV